jgi:hypothetical protein
VSAEVGRRGFEQVAAETRAVEKAAEVAMAR